MAILFVLAFSFVGLTVQLNPEGSLSFDLFELANSKKSIGSIVMVFVSLGAACVFNVIRHLILKSDQIVGARMLYVSAVLPLTAILACLQMAHLGLWFRAFEAPLTGEALNNAKLYALASFLSILFIELLIAIRVEISSVLEA